MQDKQDVFDRDNPDQRPKDQRQNVEYSIVIYLNAVVAGKYFFKRVEGTGANVPINHSFDIAAVRGDLAPSGELQVAINLGNPVLSQRDEVTGRLGGVSVALANELAKELGIAVKLTPYDAAGQVFSALEEGLCSGR
jgi:ABC-type amino acid transport substrate-binding protein